MRFWNRHERICGNIFLIVHQKLQKKKGVYFLQKVAGAFHSVGKVSATYVRAKHYEDKDVGSEEKTGVIERSKHYLVQFSLKNDPGRQEYM